MNKQKDRYFNHRKKKTTKFRGRFQHSNIGNERFSNDINKKGAHQNMQNIQQLFFLKNPKTWRNCSSSKYSSCCSSRGPGFSSQHIAPTWQFTTTSNSGSRGSDALAFSDTAHTWYTNTHKIKQVESSKKKNQKQGEKSESNRG